MEYGDNNSCCYFHTKEAIVGVCALCLKERLLILASKQGDIPLKSTKKTGTVHNKKPSITLPRIFDLVSILHRHRFRQWKSDLSDYDISTSQEDSYISIKFEDNGVASWDKGKSSKVPPTLGSLNMSYSTHNLKKEPTVVKSVIQHAKPHGVLRWRKRIGHLFQYLIRRRRSSNSKVDGVKVRKGWIRVLTKRRTME